MDCKKEKFQLRNGEHYLNCAYKAPLLKSAEEACIKAIQRDRNPMDISVGDFFDVTREVRQSFAQLINSNEQQIAIVPSVSYGFASILNNTEAKPNGKAITVADEFPSGYFALKKWCDDHQNELVVVGPTSGAPKGRSWNENLLDSIDEHTSLVLMSSVHWMDGTRFDLGRIGQRCKEVGARFLVDGTQSVGALEMDIQRYHIDALICAAYKWLLGPYSLALLFMSDAYDHGTPLEEAWVNRQNAQNFSKLTEYNDQYLPGASRYSVGENSNFILMPMLRESLNQLLEWKVENIRNYASSLIQPLLRHLKKYGSEIDEEFFCSHLFALPIPQGADPTQFQQALKANNIHLSIRGDYLRVAVNVFNTEEDIEALISVLKKSKR